MKSLFEVKKCGDGKKNQIYVIVLAAVSIGLFTLLCLLSVRIKQIPDSGQAASRWSSEDDFAQISVFYTEKSAPRLEQLTQFEDTIEGIYAQEGIVPKENGRLWISAASGFGNVRMTSNRGQMTVAAVGIVGDFFRFHPQKLLYGSLPFGRENQTNGIVIDEDIAWQLFGGSDVAGMEVMIGGESHVILGVISRECDAMEKRAGADVPTVYLSYESLSIHGFTSGLTCYEILLPDPVSGYAKDLVENGLGVGGGMSELVENSKRYSVSSLFEVVGDFGARSMKTTGFIYPSWENAARGWEDVLAVILVWQTVCVAVLVVAMLIGCRKMFAILAAEISGVIGLMQSRR